MQITNTQIANINKKMKNGFKLDMQSLCYHNEKNAVLDFRVDETHTVTGNLYFSKSYRDEFYKIILRVTEWIDSNSTGFRSSSGFGKQKEFETTLKARKFDEIIKLTEQITKEDILAILND